MPGFFVALVAFVGGVIATVLAANIVVGVYRLRAARAKHKERTENAQWERAMIALRVALGLVDILLVWRVSGVAALFVVVGAFLGTAITATSHEPRDYYDNVHWWRRKPH